MPIAFADPTVQRPKWSKTILRLLWLFQFITLGIFQLITIFLVWALLASASNTGNGRPRPASHTVLYIPPPFPLAHPINTPLTVFQIAQSRWFSSFSRMPQFYARFYTNGALRLCHRDTSRYRLWRVCTSSSFWFLRWVLGWVCRWREGLAGPRGSGLQFGGCWYLCKLWNTLEVDRYWCAMQGPILVKLGVCCHYQEKSIERIWRGRRSSTVKGVTWTIYCRLTKLEFESRRTVHGRIKDFVKKEERIPGLRCFLEIDTHNANITLHSKNRTLSCDTFGDIMKETYSHVNICKKELGKSSNLVP